MGLQDHFQPPLSTRRHWHAFHNAWATYIAADLNQRLPPGYFAEAHVQFGIEIDVATFEEAEVSATSAEASRQPLDASLINTGGEWSIPAPTQTLAIAMLTDQVEVMVFTQEAGPILTGAIELVSPANKDWPTHRGAFVSKCAAYLQQGVGLIIVDIVTDRRANLHDELLARLHAPDISLWEAVLYAVSYRPVNRSGQPSLDLWQTVMAVGHPLPTLPLCLRGNIGVPVDLDTTYQRTCREQRILAHGG